MFRWLFSVSTILVALSARVAEEAQLNGTASGKVCKDQNCVKKMLGKGNFDMCNTCATASKGAATFLGASATAATHMFGGQAGGAILGVSVKIWSKEAQLQIGRLGKCQDFQNQKGDIEKALNVGDVMVAKMIADKCTDCPTCSKECPKAEKQYKQWKEFASTIMKIANHPKFNECCGLKQAHFKTVQSAWNDYIDAVNLANGKGYKTVMEWVDPNWDFKVLYIGVPIPYFKARSWYQIPRKVKLPMSDKLLWKLVKGGKVKKLSNFLKTMEKNKSKKNKC